MGLAQISVCSCAQAEEFSDWLAMDFRSWIRLFFVIICFVMVNIGAILLFEIGKSAIFL